MVLFPCFRWPFVYKSVSEWVRFFKEVLGFVMIKRPSSVGALFFF